MSRQSSKNGKALSWTCCTTAGIILPCATVAKSKSDFWGCRGWGMSEHTKLLFPFLPSSEMPAGSGLFRDYSESSEINTWNLEERNHAAVHRAERYLVTTDRKKGTQTSWQTSSYFSLLLISILKQRDYAFLQPMKPQTDAVVKIYYTGDINLSASRHNPALIDGICKQQVSPKTGYPLQAFFYLLLEQVMQHHQSQDSDPDKSLLWPNLVISVLQDHTNTDWRDHTEQGTHLHSRKIYERTSLKPGVRMYF